MFACDMAEDASALSASGAGATYERVDVSSSLTLLIGSTLFMIVIAVQSVMLLYTMGTLDSPSGLVHAHGYCAHVVEVGSQAVWYFECSVIM